jgi:hypothetical protein
MNLSGYTFNLWGIEKPSKAKHNHPGICDLCGAPIDVEDTYYLGLTHIGKKPIMAFTCISFKCTQWLKVKELFIKDK